MTKIEYEKKISGLESDIATMIPLLEKAKDMSKRLIKAEKIIKTLKNDLMLCSNEFQDDIAEANKFLGAVNKKDVFYYAKYHKIPIYFQPEHNEVVGRNLFCEFLLWLFTQFEPLLVSEEGLKIEIEHRIITRDELREKKLLEE